MSSATPASAAVASPKCAAGLHEVPSPED